ncbi:MAG: hypothetical protein R6U52_01550 [Kosmotogaceae bacterium]
MDLVTLMTIVGCFAAVIAVMITLFLYLGSKSDNIQTSIYQEMKDFHGRLCSIESESKKHQTKFLEDLKIILTKK